MSHTAEPARRHWRRGKPICGGPTAKGARRACAFRRTAGEAPEDERRHRHGGGRRLVLWQLGVRLERRRSDDEQRARAGADDVRAATEAAPTAEAVEAAECSPGRASRQRDMVRFSTADGISLDGAMVGTGPVGVVVAHEYDNDLCGAWPFANYPAKRGLRVFVVDVRCFGRSVCPRGDAAGRVVDDLVAAVAELRQRGVTRVALVGASMGGSAALMRQASRASSRRGSRAYRARRTRPACSGFRSRPWRRPAAHRPDDVRGRQLRPGRLR